MGSNLGARATPTGQEPERAAAFRSAGFSPQGWSVGTLLRTEVRAPARGRVHGKPERTATRADGF